MMKVDKDALECDLAETYGIFDIEALPISKVALFSVGLREDSRIKMKIKNSSFNTEELLLAGISDRLTILINLVGRSKDKPMLILDQVKKQDNPSNVKQIKTQEEFNDIWNKMLGGTNG